MPDGCQAAGELWSWKLCLRTGVILNLAGDPGQTWHNFSSPVSMQEAGFVSHHLLLRGPELMAPAVGLLIVPDLRHPHPHTPNFSHSRHFTAAYEICAPMKWAKFLGKSATLWKMELPTKQHSSCNAKTEGCNVWRCLCASWWLEFADTAWWKWLTCPLEKL